MIKNNLSALLSVHILLLDVLIIAPFEAVCAFPEPYEVAIKLTPSVFLLVSANKNKDLIGLGTGFVIGKGVVATNAHVIAGASYVVAKRANADDYYVAEDLMAYNKQLDLAILSFSALSPRADAVPLRDAQSGRGRLCHG